MTAFNPPTQNYTEQDSSRESLSSVYVVRQCLVVLLWRLFIAKLFFWGLSFLVYLMPELWPTWQEVAGELSVVWIHTFLDAVEALWFVYLILAWDCQYYLITPDKIISHQGVIAKRQEICAIKNIESIDLNQSILGRIFAFGTIKLFAPTLNHTLHMDNIHRPQKKMHIIENLLPNTTSPNNNDHRRRDVLMIPHQPGHYASS